MNSSQSQPSGDGVRAAPTEAEPSAARGYRAAVAPCKSCPYRRDVPSGVWAAEEYAKLPGYDGDISDQLLAGASGLFLCHQQDGNLCGGWLAAHGPENLLALRLHGGAVYPEVWGYETRVPVFSTGAAAAAHGCSEIEAPGDRAGRTIGRLLLARRNRKAQSKAGTTEQSSRSGRNS